MVVMRLHPIMILAVVTLTGCASPTPKAPEALSVYRMCLALSIELHPHETDPKVLLSRCEGKLEAVRLEELKEALRGTPLIFR